MFLGSLPSAIGLGLSFTLDRAFGPVVSPSIGILLAASALLWIPRSRLHILTLAIRCATDYERAGVPT